MWLLLCGMATVIWLIHWRRSGQEWFDCLERDAMYLFARLWHRCAPGAAAPLPVVGPALLIANHPSHADPAFLLACSNRVLHFLQARECYEVPVLRHLFARAGCIRQALRHLAGGAVVAVFPEGDVGASNGRLGPLKAGAALLALRSGAPVFPAWIVGGPQSRHMLRAWLSPGPGVRVRFGPAIDLSAYRGRPITTALLREVAALLRRQLSILAPKASQQIPSEASRGRKPPVIALWPVAHASRLACLSRFVSRFVRGLAMSGASDRYNAWTCLRRQLRSSHPMHPDSKQDVNGAATSPSPRRFLRLGIVLAAVLAWWLLRTWLPGVSERFYLLVPPVALALAATRGELRCGKGRLLLGLLGMAALAVACIAYNLALTAPLYPAGDGYWRGLRLPEVALALYFLLALYLLAAAARRGLLPPLMRFCDRLTRRQRIARIALGETIALAALAPVLVSAFHVHRFKVPNPARPASLNGRSVADISFATADGLTLRGWFLEAQRPSGRTLVICHGMGANRTEVLPYVAVADALQANALLFDLRGHGDSDGHTVSFGQHERLDVRGAIAWLRRSRPQQARQIIGLGVSMGCAALIGAAAELDVPVDALVLDSGFADATDMTEPLLRNVPAPLRPCLARPALLLASLDSACWLPELRPVDQIAAVRAPTLFIHALDDRLVPVGQARQLYDRACGARQLWLTETGDHGSAFHARTAYLERVSHFVRTRCSEP
jgi:1-acyl-sn-glycerol-3-phosphate acyltransferase/pimeloyl-ACP methyl ester carboxylesterase